MVAPITAAVFTFLTVFYCVDAIPSSWQLTSELQTRDASLQVYNESVTCLAAGVQCTSCTQLSLCVSSSSGFFEFPVEECNTRVGEHCSPSLKKCENKKSSCSLDWEFECWEEGTFPDPFDCNLYYTCSKVGGTLQVKKRECTAGSAYNAKTFRCDLKDTDPICKGYPVPECPSSGVTAGPLPQNGNIYYVCTGGLPQLFKCLEGDDYVYDSSLYACVVWDGETTTTSSTTSSTTDVTTTSTDVTTSSTTTNQPGACAPGLYYTIPYACKSAYYCDSERQYLMECALDSLYYDRDVRDCKVGSCPYDDEWKVACPSTANRPVPGTCSIYYNCASKTEDVLNCRSGYFNRETLTCSTGVCPYDNF